MKNRIKTPIYNAINMILFILPWQKTQVTNSLFSPFICIAIFCSHVLSSIFYRHFSTNKILCACAIEIPAQEFAAFINIFWHRHCCISQFKTSIGDYSNDIERYRIKKNPNANQLFIPIVFIFKSAPLFVLHSFFLQK